jgi:small subunit ribosomal protein S5
VRCSQYIFEMCRCLGIQDLSARVTRSRNPMNVIKTFMKALKSQKLPEVIARGRGKKFVDVRKVYYGGSA